MRVLVTTLLVACGLLTLSIHAQPQTARTVPLSEIKFTGNVSAGETIVLTSSSEGISIQVPSKEELDELVATDEERRQYDEVRQFLNKVRSREASREEMSDELKALQKKYESLDDYMSSMRDKMRRTVRKVTRTGDDFIAYRRENREVILPLHRIILITRSIQK